MITARSAEPVIVRRGRAARAGFTLIEIMAVILILGILMWVLLPRLLGTAETARLQLTRARITTIESAITNEYQAHFGDFPPSSWPDTFGAAPNATNVGAEVLVQSLWSRDYGGTSLPDDMFCNVDEDDLKKPVSRLPALALLEFKDAWDNPIAYIHRRDYEKQLAYITHDSETGEAVESNITGQRSGQTKAFHSMNKFQLISAGADGRFGTDDDIGNWAPEAKE